MTAILLALMADQDSPARVAFDLMKLIEADDVKAPEQKQRDPKAYWLDLYKECLRVVLERPTPRT